MPDLNLRLILTAPPDSVTAAQGYGLPVAHMAYRLGPGLRLLRAQLPLTARGGLMLIGDEDFDGSGDPALFCQEVIKECAARGFDGVMLDLERPVSPLLGKVVSELSALLVKRGWPLFVPEEYARFAEKSRVMISSALSGGSLAQRLEEAVRQYGPARIALCVERTAEDFYLPAPEGRGAPLTRENLRRRIAERSPTVFYSKELCARYFTYMSRQSGAHFVMFDDAETMRRKLLLADSLNIRSAILAYPQVDDLLDEILA
ncbi:hypothetical protein SDC9_91984 [bioreactor metagenome]|uniref:Uncharacterized protein n=1 Tax=bioreactor metagenome TaxID=1076179 RepID=A0A644ZXZ5_9ZZZZ